MYVARPQLGTKRLCVGCAVRFYDLNRLPAQCPACAKEQPPPAPRSRAVPRVPGQRWQARPAAQDVAAVADDAVPLLEVAGDEEDEDEAEVAGIDEAADDPAAEEDEAR